MATLKTFTFDFDFDDDQLMKQMVNEEINEEINEVDTVPLPEPEIIPPTFNEAELNAARLEGFDAGKENGITETMAELENSIAQTLSTIVNEIMELSNRQTEFNQQIKVETITLLNKLIGKLFPLMNEQIDIDETIHFSRSILPELLTEPIITFRVPEGLDQKIKSQIEPILKDNGYGGELIVIGEAETPLGACTVEWSSGSAERDSEFLLSEIEKRLLDAIDNELLTKNNNNMITSAEMSENENVTINDEEIDKATEQSSEVSHPEIPDKSSHEETPGSQLNHDDTTVEQGSDKQNENYEQIDENS